MIPRSNSSLILNSIEISSLSHDDLLSLIIEKIDKGSYQFFWHLYNLGLDLNEFWVNTKTLIDLAAEKISPNENIGMTMDGDYSDAAKTALVLLALKVKTKASNKKTAEQLTKISQLIGGTGSRESRLAFLKARKFYAKEFIDCCEHFPRSAEYLMELKWQQLALITTYNPRHLIVNSYPQKPAETQYPITLAIHANNPSELSQNIIDLQQQREQQFAQLTILKSQITPPDYSENQPLAQKLLVQQITRLISEIRQTQNDLDLKEIRLLDMEKVKANYKHDAMINASAETRNRLGTNPHNSDLQIELNQQIETVTALRSNILDMENRKQEINARSVSLHSRRSDFMLGNYARPRYSVGLMGDNLSQHAGLSDSSAASAAQFNMVSGMIPAMMARDRQGTVTIDDAPRQVIAHQSLNNEILVDPSPSPFLPYNAIYHPEDLAMRENAGPNIIDDYSFVHNGQTCLQAAMSAGYQQLCQKLTDKGAKCPEPPKVECSAAAHDVSIKAKLVSMRSYEKFHSVLQGITPSQLEQVLRELIEDLKKVNLSKIKFTVDNKKNQIRRVCEFTAKFITLNGPIELPSLNILAAMVEFKLGNHINPHLKLQ